MQHVVFVYGSLKRGESNFGLMGNSPLVCRARTGREFRIYSWGRYPTLARVEHDALAIQGEVYRVDDEVLAALDRLEDNGRTYQREVVTVFDLDSEATHQAWVYLHVGPVGALELLSGDRWSGSV